MITSLPKAVGKQTGCPLPTYPSISLTTYLDRRPSIPMTISSIKPASVCCHDMNTQCDLYHTANKTGARHISPIAFIPGQQDDLGDPITVAINNDDGGGHNT